VVSIKKVAIIKMMLELPFASLGHAHLDPLFPRLLPEQIAAV
jgi:hypothetical protein